MQKLGVVPPELPVVGAVHPVNGFTGIKVLVKDTAAVSTSV